jgi:predicted ribosomally synthesized peptide with SipW-like signal peptide
MKIKLKKARLTVIAAAIPLSLVLLVTSTYAWFQAKDSVSNVITVGQRQFSIPAVDVFTPPTDPIKPGGAAVDKRVSATNTGSIPGFVRVLVLPTAIGSDGKSLLPARLGSEITLGQLSGDWADGGDGYYYYLKVLPPGATAPDLFNKVSLAAGLGDAYKGATFKIEIKSEAIDTAKWNYRIGWWGTDAVPSAVSLAAVDKVLQGLAS